MPAPLTPPQMERVEVLTRMLRHLDTALGWLAEREREVRITVEGDASSIDFKGVRNARVKLLLRAMRAGVLAELRELGVTLSRWPDAPEVSPVPPPAPAPQPPPRRWPPAWRWLDRFR